MKEEVILTLRELLLSEKPLKEILEQLNHLLKIMMKKMILLNRSLITPALCLSSE